MTFGKHRGKHIADVPTSYLLWCISEGVTSYPGQAAFRAELDRRGYGYSHDEPPDATASVTVMAEVRTLVNKWHGRLALRFHPDRGGDHRSMLVVNEARDLLLEMLEAQP